MNPPRYNHTDEMSFLSGSASRGLLALNLVLGMAYFVALLLMPRGYPPLYWALVAGGVFYLWQLFTYIYTVWDTSYRPPMDSSYRPSVDIFITVAGEPVEIVEETARAALNMRYASFKVYILNDGYVAKKENWRDIELMAERIGASCITRKKPGDAKAGNINNALAHTSGDLVVVFDADHVPRDDFLEKTVGYFADPQMGFVQSPQFYKNHSANLVTEGAWEQQALFFGSICRGKNRLNSVTMCGTNMVIRRKALAEAGNVSNSIAEDFLTGMMIHMNGWKSAYVPEVLAEGLAPEDFLSYYKQQFRWARGALDVFLGSGFLWSRRLTLAQKVQYLSSVSYFVSGAIVLMHALIPLVFLYTGLVPLQISTMAVAALFLPYIIVTVYALQASSNFSYSFRSLAFSMAGFHIHIRALMAMLLRRKSSFSITSKRRLTGNFIRLVIPQIVYIGAAAAGVAVAIARDGFSASVVTNIAWAALNVAIFAELVRAALPQPEAGAIRTAGTYAEQANPMHVSSHILKIDHALLSSTNDAE